MKTDLTRFTVAPTDTIRTAMEKITDNRLRVVIVVDEGKVIGTVSDGDIRRAFLHDMLPIAPVERIMQLNPHVTTETDPQRRHEEILREKVTLLPVVDDEMRLLDVELGYEPFAE